MEKNAEEIFPVFEIEITSHGMHSLWNNNDLKRMKRKKLRLSTAHDPGIKKAGNNPDEEEEK